MPYNMVVLAKQVPDTKNITGEAMKEDGTVNRAALPAIFNSEDRNALEMALEVRDRYGGFVTVITMGAPSVTSLLQDSLAMGADRGILLTDRRFARADTLATSYTLALAIGKVGSVDLVFCGRQAIDGDTAQVGPQIAEKLNIGQITYVEQIRELQDRSITARRDMTGGYEIIRAALPVLLTVTGAANTPRPPAARRIMQFKKASTPSLIRSETTNRLDESGIKDPDRAERETQATIEKLAQRELLLDEWDAEALGADMAAVGGSGSPTIVRHIESIQLVSSGFKRIEPSDEGVSELVNELINDHTLG